MSSVLSRCAPWCLLLGSCSSAVVAVGCASNGAGLPLAAAAQGSNRTNSNRTKTSLPGVSAPGPTLTSKIIRLSGPPAYVECTTAWHVEKPRWELGRGSGPELIPESLERARERQRTAAQEPLPFGSVPEFKDKVRPSADSVGSFVAVDGGWIVAVGSGEFGPFGVYWLAKGAAHPVRLDEYLFPSIDTVVEAKFGILGTTRCIPADDSTVFQVFESGASDQPWLLSPRAQLKGCVEDLSVGPGARSVLIAHGGLLTRIDQDSVQTVASWPDYLRAYQVLSIREGEYYLVFHEGSAARFTATSAEWYRSAACPRIEGANLVRTCECVRSSGSTPAVPRSASAEPTPTRSSARVVEPATAMPVQGLLDELAKQVMVAGSKPVGLALVGKFKTGQTLEKQVQLQPQKCYTIVASGFPSVTEINLQLVAVGPPSKLSPVLAADRGSTAVIGKKPGCYKWSSPLPAAAKVVAEVTAGAGIAAVQVYEK